MSLVDKIIANSIKKLYEQYKIRELDVERKLLLLVQLHEYSSVIIDYILENIAQFGYKSFFDKANELRKRARKNIENRLSQHKLSIDTVMTILIENEALKYVLLKEIFNDLFKDKLKGQGPQ